MWIKFRKGKAVNLNHYGSLEVVEHPHYFYESSVKEKHFTLTAIREQKRTDYIHLATVRQRDHAEKLFGLIQFQIETGVPFFDLHDFLADSFVKML